MSSENEKSFLSRPELEVADLEGVQVVRDQAGIWRYADSWIPVPGAQDVTLTDRFDPKLVISGGGDIERVVVSRQNIETEPELLDWCLAEGRAVWDEEELIEVLVPYDLWQERDRVPGELISPEHHGDEAEQDVAAAERRYREAEKHLALAAEERADILRRWADAMTRQEARFITGLSVGRVQQLIRAEKVESQEKDFLELFEDGPVETIEVLQDRAARKGIPGDPDLLLSHVRELEDRALLQYVDDRGLLLTEEGTQALLEAQVVDKGNEEE